MILCVDLSSKCTGISKFSKDGKLMKKDRIIPATDINPYFKIHYIVEQLKEYYDKVDDLIIEDLYYGKNIQSILYLARLSGAVAYSWIAFKYKVPIFYTASHARKLAGINGASKKAEVQVFVLEKYNFAPPKDIREYKEKILELKQLKKDKTIKPGAIKYRFDKLSKLIDLETGIGEDVADSIILGLAYQKD